MERISVTDPIGLAMARVRQVLFNPFDLAKWFAIGFCAWLALLGEQGGFNGRFNFGGGHPDHGGREIQQEFEHARNFVMDNLAWLLPLVIFLFIVGLLIGVLLLWLNSRGKFMFLHCVVYNRGEVVDPWHRYRALADSLFWFRFVLSLIGMVFVLPLIVFIVLALLPMIRTNTFNFALFLPVIGLGMGLFVIALVFTLIRKLTTDFVVPIMFLRNSRCLAAWSEFRQLLAARFWDFVIYILFQIVIHICIGVMVLVVVLATCCIAGCLLSLPYLGTVLFLPVIMFTRAYSLYYLAQFGPSYNVFQPVAAV